MDQHTRISNVARMLPAPALVWRRIDSWGAAAVVAALALVLHDAIRPATTLLVTAIGVLYWFGYTINDYFDAPFDRRQPDKARSNFFVLYDVPRPAVILAAAVVMGLLVVAFAQFSAHGLALLALGSAAMWSYSAPPLRLKSRPGLDLLAHALFVLTFPYVIAHVLAGSAWSPMDVVLIAICFLSSLGGQFSQQVRDFDVDSRTDANFTTTYGLRTSVTCLRLTTVAAIAVFITGIVLAIVPPVVIPLALLSAPVQIERLRARPGGYASAPWHDLLSAGALAYAVVLVSSALLE